MPKEAGQKLHNWSTGPTCSFPDTHNSHRPDTTEHRLFTSMTLDELDIPLLNGSGPRDRSRQPSTSKQMPSKARKASDGKKFVSSLTTREGRQTVALDFASKGLTEVQFKENGEDEGSEARLHGTALYSPAPGWPLGYGDRRPTDLEDVTYPIRVNFRIALTNTPEGEPSPSP